MPQRPQPGEYKPFQAAYIALVTEDDILAVLSGQIETIEQLAATITREQETFRYAPGKWSVRQVFGHLADAERIFGYRALCIARGQKEPLPPFDENLFVETANFDRRTVVDLAAELILLRRASLSMMHAFEDSAWTQTCLSNAAITSTRAIVWTTAGHLRHHIAILKDRYGI
jgi:hypothetical protein